MPSQVASGRRGRFRAGSGRVQRVRTGAVAMMLRRGVVRVWSVVRLVSHRDSPPVDLQQAKEPPVRLRVRGERRARIGADCGAERYAAEAP